MLPAAERLKVPLAIAGGLAVVLALASALTGPAARPKRRKPDIISMCEGERESPPPAELAAWVKAKAEAQAEVLSASFRTHGLASFSDAFTDTVLQAFEGEQLRFKRIGGGEGLHDESRLKLFGHIDPCDVQQRGIGDCWLMCSIAAVAEFDDLIAHLFAQAELSKSGKYTLRLFDLPRGQWRQYDVDSRLVAVPAGKKKSRSARRPDSGLREPKCVSGCSRGLTDASEDHQG